MLRVLLDQNVPRGVRGALAEHDVRTAVEQGLDAMRNGDLLAAAERAKFDVFVTCDKNLRYKQNIAGRGIAIVILGTNHWLRITSHLRLIAEALLNTSPGTCVQVDIPDDPSKPHGNRSSSDLAGEDRDG